MQKAARLRVVSEEPLIRRHAAALSEIDAKRREMAAQSKAIRQDAFADGMRPFAFRTVMRLRRMKPQDAKAELEHILMYAEDLEMVRQADLFE